MNEQEVAQAANVGEPTASGAPKPTPPFPNGALTREAILERRGQLRIERVDVPEWGGVVYVQEGTAADRDVFENDATRKVPGPKGRTRVDVKTGFRARLVVRAIVDADGNRLFNDSDVSALMELGVVGIERVYDVAARLWGITDSDEAELLGNSGSVPSADSDTFSP